MPNAATSPAAAAPALEPPGRNALVTGAGQRIGRTIAIALARQGFDVAVHYGRSKTQAESVVAEIQRLGRRACAIGADLTDVAALGGLLPACRAALGPISVLINNAARFEFDDARDFSVTELGAHMATNLTAPVALASAMHRTLAEDETGVVVNLLDQKLFNYNPDFLSYSLSKAALHAATIMLAQAFAPRLRVVGVAPGLTMASHLQSQEQFDYAHRLGPLGRSSEPDDIADAVCFAVRSRAITGTTIVVDGGQHLVGFERDFSLMSQR